MDSASHSPGLPSPLSHSQPVLDDPALNMAKASWVVGEVPECFSLGMAVPPKGEEMVAVIVMGSDHTGVSKENDAII